MFGQKKFKKIVEDAYDIFSKTCCDCDVFDVFIYDKGDFSFQVLNFYIVIVLQFLSAEEKHKRLN